MMRERPGSALLGAVETLLLCAIVVILVLFVYTNIRRIGVHSKMSIAKTQVMESLPAALESYYLDIGEYPSTAQGLDALWDPPYTVDYKWKGPYITPNLRDPWGREYRYIYPSSHGDGVYDLWSSGPEPENHEGHIVNWKTDISIYR